MQSPVRRQVARFIAATAAAACAGHAQAQLPPARQAAQIQITTEVPAGTHKSLRLRNVPAEARVAFAIQASGRIVVSLLTEADVQRYPAVTEALFTAPVDKALSFSVAIPAAGTYFVVFDNTRGAAVSQVRMVFRAARAPGATPQPLPPSARDPGSTDAPSRLRQRPGMHEM